MPSVSSLPHEQEAERRVVSLETEATAQCCKQEGATGHSLVITSVLGKPTNFSGGSKLEEPVFRAHIVFSTGVTSVTIAHKDRSALSVVAVFNLGLTAEEQVSTCGRSVSTEKCCAGSRTCPKVRTLRPEGAVWSSTSRNMQVGGSAVQVVCQHTPQDKSMRDHLALHTRRLDTFEKMVVEVQAIAHTRAWRIVPRSHGPLSLARKMQGKRLPRINANVKSPRRKERAKKARTERVTRIRRISASAVTRLVTSRVSVARKWMMSSSDKHRQEEPRTRCQQQDRTPPVQTAPQVQTTRVEPLRMLTLPTCFKEEWTADDQVYRLYSLHDSGSDDGFFATGEDNMWLSLCEVCYHHIVGAVLQRCASHASVSATGRQRASTTKSCAVSSLGKLTIPTVFKVPRLQR